MKKVLSFLFIFACFCSQSLVFAETDTKQSQYLTDTKATIAVQKQPSQDANQCQKIQNVRWSIIIQVQGKAVDIADTDAK